MDLLSSSSREIGQQPVQEPISETAHRPSSSESEQTCPVCWDDLKMAVETNCRHIYCGECIFNVVDLGDRGFLETPTCPYCRQQMTVLLPYFSQAEISEKSDAATHKSRRDILNKIKEYNKIYSGQPKSFS